MLFLELSKLLSGSIADQVGATCFQEPAAVSIATYGLAWAEGKKVLTLLSGPTCHVFVSVCNGCQEAGEVRLTEKSLSQPGHILTSHSGWFTTCEQESRYYDRHY